MDSQKQFETQAEVMQTSNAIRDTLNNLNCWEKEIKQREKQKKDQTFEVRFIYDFHFFSNFFFLFRIAGFEENCKYFYSRNEVHCQYEVIKRVLLQ